MKFLKNTALSFVILSSYMNAQTDGIPMTPEKNVPLYPQKIVIPEKFKKEARMLADSTINLPQGWEATLFQADQGLLGRPRFMAWGPDSVLHITDMSLGNIVAMPDKNNDGVADTAFTVATDITAHSFQFYNGALYAAESGQVLKLTDENSDGIYETKTPIITGIPTGGNHSTRTIVFDASRKKLYLSIGSRCNVCREDDRAIIKEYNDDGTDGRIYATGIRNAVGMTIHPVTGKLWANNNGSDMQGNDIPPEWIDIVREDGFYGYPFAYHHQQYFNFSSGDYKQLLPITAADSARVRSMKLPGALIQAHSAPMGIEFSNASFPDGFKNGAFMALRGAWNSTLPYGSRPGYKLVYLQFDSPDDTIASGVTDIVTGFQFFNGLWARPVGVAVDHKGNIYLGSDDFHTFVLKISPKKPATGINENEGFKNSQFSIFPNPASENITVRFPEAITSNVVVSITNILGKEVQRFELGEIGSEHIFQTATLQPGMYFCKIQYNGRTEVQEFQVIR